MQYRNICSTIVWTNRRASLKIVGLFKLFYFFRGNDNEYLCDFAKRCPLSFCLNTGIARVQASVAGKKPGGLPSC